ncbi:hypothetical protein HY993_02100 [Candidatus Micrarchaeota archaeon]|nr:hypothetical protein [Candidatus Micrarchaeota archaeon]
MAAKFLVKKFDEDLVGLVKSGTSGVAQICALMGVEEKDARKRIAQLVKKKLLVYDAHCDLAGLSVDGYSFFEEKKRRAEKQAVQLPSPSSLIQPVQTNFIQSPQAAGAKQGSPAVDLHELMRIGAPNGEQKKRQKQFPKAASIPQPAASRVQEPAPATTPFAERAQSTSPSDDKCELCKSAFSLSVGKGSSPKFGHCFCGAAYHKDCFESIADNNSSCIRCGRKLELSVDKKTVEIVKGIKDAFED